MNERIHSEENQNEIIYYRPCIIVFAGPPLVGKTTAGREIEKVSNLVYLDVDSARISLYGYQERGADAEEAVKMLASYQHNHELAEKLLSQGIPVVLGATYSREKYHELIKDLQQKTKLPVRVLIFKTSDAELKRRVDDREKEGSLSNVRDFPTAKRLKDRYTPMTEDFVTYIDGSVPVGDVIGEIQKLLKDLEANN